MAHTYHQKIYSEQWREVNAYGVILSDVCARTGIKLIQNNEQLSERCCNPCARKVRNLGQLHAFILKNTNGQCKTPEKPKSGKKQQLNTPNKSSLAWSKKKAACIHSPKLRTPKSRKSLNMSENLDPASSKTNKPRKDDDLDTFFKRRWSSRGWITS